MAAAAPQPCRPRSTTTTTTTTLAALMEDIIEEILLRIPPDEPAHLIRAALVCKSWRHTILSVSDDPAGFLHRYRAFHRRHTPLLGFFYNEWCDYAVPPQFMPVASAFFPSLLAHYRRRAWCVVDCRHGRVLLESVRTNDLIIWDQISNDWQELQAQGIYFDSYSAAVFCAAASVNGCGCDHHDCCRRGGPFFVVCLGVDADDMDDTTIKVCVYSSEQRAWGTPVSDSSQLHTGCVFDKHRAAVIGDGIYFIAGPDNPRILKYDLVKHCISWFTPPSSAGKAPVQLMQNEDGSLGLASVVRDSRLYLWSSRMVNNREGKIVAEWVQERVIELDTILPIDKQPSFFRAYVTGFAEGVGILFISSDLGTFTFKLAEPGRARKITTLMDFSTAFPFISFFTPCNKAVALY